MHHGVQTIGGSSHEVFMYLFDQCYLAKRTFYPKEYKIAID